MTPAKAALLRKLRDEGPQLGCSLPDYGSTGWIERRGLGFMRRFITPAGLAALAEHEKGEG